MAGKEKAVIDRVEGKIAVLLVGEEETKLDVLVSSLPRKAKEGDWLKVEIAGSKVVSAEIDAEETAKRKERILGLMEKLRKKG